MRRNISSLICTLLLLCGLAGNALGHLHPTLETFIQRDPIGYAASLNLFEYVRSNPANRIDASGLFPPGGVPPTIRPPSRPPSAPPPPIIQEPQQGEILITLRPPQPVGLITMATTICYDVTVDTMSECEATLDFQPTDPDHLEGCNWLREKYEDWLGGLSLCERLAANLDRQQHHRADCVFGKRCKNKHNFAGEYRVGLQIDVRLNNIWPSARCRVTGSGSAKVKFTGWVGCCQ